MEDEENVEAHAYHVLMFFLAALRCVFFDGLLYIITLN
jgi:hypothetical protein